MTSEIFVLGAGIVGVSVALHLQQRGRDVVLVDRNAPGEGASFGNAGLIERASVIPYAIPRDWRALLGHASNRNAAVRYDPAFLPRIAPWLLGYWRASHPDRLATIAGELLPLIEACLGEHERLVEAAGLSHLLRRDGWIEVVRSAATLDEAGRRSSEMRSGYGLVSDVLDRQALARLEPALLPAAVGGIHWRDPFTVSDPGALTKGYATLFEMRGGTIRREAVSRIAPDRAGWRIVTENASHRSGAVVVALGVHSNTLLSPLGYRVPLVGKRGYHMHFRPEGEATLRHAVLDEEIGYVMSPMAAGIRLTTGVELAAPDAPANRVQLDRAERRAREIFPLGKPVEDKPWIGLRPATPDMKPVIGPARRHPGLWLAFGHAHHGLTLGPATGRLLAELMTGETPFADPSPFDIARFL
ncbi:amino acid dehydrogenase [Metarhizobium album]|uniref:Amino acid dehydrogenase n=2 Tax=Metarhizobium album TaxID=2182425 RepID=A0A2U2DIX2_9HYPH|nr:amino acid dehydrogenase [Rhizobium album]